MLVCAIAANFALGSKKHFMFISFAVVVEGGGGGFAFCMLPALGLLLRLGSCDWEIMVYCDFHAWRLS